MKKRIKHHEIVGRLATRVRDCRTRMGLSQYDLAAKAA